MLDIEKSDSETRIEEVTMKWILIGLMAVLVGCGSDDNSTKPVDYPEGIFVLWPTVEDTVDIYVYLEDDENDRYCPLPSTDSIYTTIHAELPGGVIRVSVYLGSGGYMTQASGIEFDALLKRSLCFSLSNGFAIDSVITRQFHVVGFAGDGSEWRSQDYTFNYRYVVE